MSTQKRVYERLSKVDKLNLEADKVELAKKEFNTFVKESQSIYLDARNLAQKHWFNFLEAFEKGESKLISLENELEAEISRVNKLAKDIGIDIKGTAVGKNIQNAEAEVKHYRKSFANSIKKVKSSKI